ncbi:MAG: hypothetical protein HWE24_01920, partial [Oceanospirillaceae bacterium]|nr:hypothetical protein [Oceanospirillaceae bacterium]
GEGGRWKGNALLPNNAESSSHGFAGTDVAPASLAQAYEADSVDNGCHRAHSAPIHGLREDFDETVNLACSGAKNKHLWPLNEDGSEYRGEPQQLDQLEELMLTNEVQLIVLGVGGNDMGFSSLIVECMVSYAINALNPIANRHCRDEVDLRVGELFHVERKVKKTIELTRAKMASAGKLEGLDYKILLMGYPSVTADSTDVHMGNGDSHINFYLQCPFDLGDLAYVDQTLIGPMNGMYASIAKQMNVNFLSVKEAFNGHKLCDGRNYRGFDQPDEPMQASTREWVRFLDIPYVTGIEDIADRAVELELEEPVSGEQGRVQESMHPNYFGQEAIGACLKQMWTRMGQESDSKSFECFMPRSVNYGDYSDLVVAEKQRNRTINIPGTFVPPGSSQYLEFEVDFNEDDANRALNSAFVEVMGSHYDDSDFTISLVTPTGQIRSILYRPAPGDGDNNSPNPGEGGLEPLSIGEPGLPYNGHSRTVYLLKEAYNNGVYRILLENNSPSFPLIIDNIDVTIL